MGEINSLTWHIRNEIIAFEYEIKLQFSSLLLPSSIAPPLFFPHNNQINPSPQLAKFV